MFDTNRIICFSIKKNQKNNSIYKVFCEIEAGEQEHYYNFVKESFSNLPGLENNRYVTFLIEPNCINKQNHTCQRKPKTLLRRSYFKPSPYCNAERFKSKNP